MWQRSRVAVAVVVALLGGLIGGSAEAFAGDGTSITVTATGPCALPQPFTRLEPDASRACTARIQNTIAQCNSSTACRAVYLEPSRMFPIMCPRHNEAGLSLNHTINFTFGSESAGSPASLLVDYRPALCRGVVAQGAIGLTIQHLRLDTIRPPFTLLRAVAVTAAPPGSHSSHIASFVTAQAGPDADLSPLASGAMPWLGHVDLMFAFDVEGDRIVNTKRKCHYSAPSPESDLPGAMYQPMTLVNDTVQMPCNGTSDTLPLPGSIFIARHYSNHGAVVWCVRCRNFTAVGVVIHSGAGMGLRCDLCTGNTRFIDGCGMQRRRRRRVGGNWPDYFMQHMPTVGQQPTVEPLSHSESNVKEMQLGKHGDTRIDLHKIRGSASRKLQLWGDRLPMSGTADCFHYMCGRDTITVANGHCEGQGDDNMNVHCNYVTLLGGFSTETQGTYAYRNDHGAGWLTSLPKELIGEPVAFLRGDTMQTLTNSSAVATVLWSNESHVRLSRCVPHSFVFGRDVLVFTRAVSPLVTVTNSLFNRTRSKGLMISAAALLVDNNRFERVPHAHVLLGSGPAIYAAYTEGPAVQSAIVANNVFIEGGDGSQWDALAPVQVTACGQRRSQRWPLLAYDRACHPVLDGSAVYGNVTVVDNTFIRRECTSPFVVAGALRSVIIRRNRVMYNSAQAPLYDGCLYTPATTTSAIVGNVCVGPGGSNRSCSFESGCLTNGHRKWSTSG